METEKALMETKLEMMTTELKETKTKWKSVTEKTQEKLETMLLNVMTDLNKMNKEKVMTKRK